MPGDPIDEERLFTPQDLRRFNGESSRIYIAYGGIVYDLTDCPKWRTGMHEGLHFPAQDLTSEIVDAPHNSEVFMRPCVKRVGRLV